MPIVKLSVFGKSEQTTTTGKNLWSLGDVSFNGYKELSVNYPAGNYVLSYNVDTPASSMTVQVGINIDGNWKYNQVKKDNRAAIKIYSATGITAVRFYAGDSPAVKDNAEYYNIQIEKGADATDYEPYTGGKPSPSSEYPQEITNCGEDGTINLEITGDNAEPQALTLSTPNGLLGLKVNSGGNYTDSNGQQWICDEIDLARGKYIQRIRKIILDGFERWYTWGKNANGNIGFYLYPNKSDNPNNISYYECICNYLPYNEDVYNGNTTGVKIVSSEDYLLYYIVFSVKQSDLKDVSTNELAIQSLKEFLSAKKAEGKPVEIYCKLSKQKETDLPPEIIATFKKLHTNYPNTIISNNADAGMELTYTVDTQSYIDGKIATLSKALL